MRFRKHPKSSKFVCITLLRLRQQGFETNNALNLSLRVRQQSFESNRLQNSFNKVVNRHGLIVEKYGTALREMTLAIQA